MRKGRIGAARVALFVGFTLAVPGSVSAQQGAPEQPSIMVDEGPAVAPRQTPQPQSPVSPQPAKPARARAQMPALEPDPGLDAADQLAPSQIVQPMPGAVSTPGRTGAGAAAVVAQTAPAAKPAAAKPSAPPTRLVVACSGPFGRDSSHLKLAMTYETKNLDFGEVEASGGRAVASILYPKDPKRRLEVWWSNPTNRKDTYLIVINGRSTWTGPGGLRLGLSLAEVEKLNGKPFKLSGFNKDGVAAVSSWDGGKLAALDGNCKAGVSARADAKAAADALAALPADHEYTSADPAMRAVNPAISEILIGY
ncbi:MAG TPA: hypothetical protein VK430_08045 [Xanthobacteraceae bacterium]|nr:hypothetical protein [Xanthobacteraceae bacterium]